MPNPAGDAATQLASGAPVTRLLFDSDGLAVRVLARDELGSVQALFEANTSYFLTVAGRLPLHDEALQEYDELPPPQLTFTCRWFAGVFNRAGDLVGLLILVSDLAAPRVWHTALFLLDQALHGSGAAQRLHAALEGFARAGGAQWLRLAVIQGNLRAEHFWAACGYTEVRTRTLVDATGQTRVSRVMVKPLDGGTLGDYWALVPRDLPGSSLP